ncbi:collagen-like protein [Papillibacter cinnamivorans]|uniref:Collagen triple helix repeat-containing protein n=1 Tax=Papillibacter cinnamivorans DSM 12816 TaxID=1122930 RepID=A0A1W2C5Z9_9FIRM|nr:collagen-like protein [Papillibacter cinnamivorans]SMC80444.1 hypothetical protein SAMN02745168_2572 [Papillibacter cinnamivorans DSM 12816]
MSENATKSYVQYAVSRAGLKGEQGERGMTGAAGPAGAAAAVAVGTVTTLSAGASAAVSNSGTSSAAVLNFAIPQGAKGETGDTGLQGPQGTPGETGPMGEQGIQGPAGADGTDGVGIPPGGSAGQYLTKSDGTDYNVGWADLPGDMTASEILAAVKTVDGSGSGLDADTLDGNEAAAFAAASHTHTAAGITDFSGAAVSAVSAEDEYLKNTGDSANGSYTFDGETLCVDAANHRIGIGTASPSKALVVYGSTTYETQLTGNAVSFTRTGGDSYIEQIGTGKLRFRMSSGLTDTVTLSGDGKVGIRNIAPAEALDVDGNIAVSGTVDGRDIAADGAALDGKASDSGVVHNTGNETVSGVKTFSSFPVTPSAAPTNDYDAANKKYVDDQVAGAGSGFEIGDIFTTMRTDLGSEWLLCNGGEINLSTYPSLASVCGPDPSAGMTQGTTPAVYYYGIAYGNGYFVRVGYSGKISYKAATPDGTWTENNQSSSANFISVAYGNGYWVATGDGGTLYYKAGDPNGTWTSNTQGYRRFYGVAYGNGYWVAVGEYGTMYYKSSTPNGTWTSKTVGSSLQTNLSVAYGDGYWAISNDQYLWTISGAPSGTWSSATSVNYGMRSIIYGNGYWVGTYSGGVSYRAGANPNGAWTIKTAASLNGTVWGVAYNSGYYYVVSSYGTWSYVAGNPGNTWVAGTNPGSSITFGAICAGNNCIAAMGYYNTTYYCFYMLPKLPAISIGAYSYIKAL